MAELYVSTGGLSRQTASETVALLHSHGIRDFELSGGLHEADWLEKIEAYTDCRFMLHNYFPPPEEPFVLNLCAGDDGVVKRGIAHVKGAIAASSRLGARFYGLHAGFLVDLQVSDLGRQIKARSMTSRSWGLSRYLEHLNQLAEFADQYNVELLIEDNVLTQANWEKYNGNPLLMVDAEECLLMMRETPDNVGLLIDVGHLNVSANVLGLDREDFLRRCDPWVKGYHLSDNDGRIDSNGPIDSNSWFWRFLNRDVEFMTLEVYQPANMLVDQLKLARNILGAK